MTEQDLRAVRAARNQTLFRNVNAKLVELNRDFERLSDRSVFICECARIECIAKIDMLLSDYERVRSNPRHFVVAPSEDHVVAAVERIVETRDGYFVVEKIGVAADIAEKSAAG